MSMRPLPIEPVPEETARIARAAFRKGNLLMRIRDEIGVLYDDQMFVSLYDARGQLAIAPWRLALVTVSDRGSGIEAELASELFKPFYRHPGTATNTSGLGIGLTVCKRLAEAQGGHIQARAREGGGSVFAFAASLLSESDFPSG